MFRCSKTVVEKINVRLPSKEHIKISKSNYALYACVRTNDCHSRITLAVLTQDRFHGNRHVFLHKGSAVQSTTNICHQGFVSARSERVSHYV